MASISLGRRGLLVGLVALTGLGCSPESPKLLPKPTIVKEEVRAVGTRVTFNPSLDILIVVDDSGSMSSHQQNLANNIRLFTQGILANQILDYHIGVVTTSDESAGGTAPCCGELNGSIKYVERNTPGGMNVLAQNLVVGTSGSATETMFAPMIKALSQPMVSTLNAGFYRQDAHLAVVYITDAEDQSNYTPAQAYDFLVQLKGDKDKVITYGVIVPANQATQGCSQDGGDPVKLEQFFQISGGKFFGLCDPDYGSKLSALGSDLEQRVGRTMLLQRTPDPSTIIVRYGSKTIPNDPVVGWTYDPARNALNFGRKMDVKGEPPGTQLEVDFIAADF